MNRKEMLEGLAEGKDPLVLSIQKWVDISEGRGVCDGAANCALCEAQEDYRCSGCLVYIRTQRPTCRKTPYEKLNLHSYEVHGHHFEVLSGECRECAELIVEEIEFLRSLQT